MSDRVTLEPFTFGIALMARPAARRWSLVEGLLGLTLASVFAQTDQEFSVIIMGHDRPAVPDDPRLTFVEADWPADSPRHDNLDSWRKKHAIKDIVAASRAGLLMFLDADDWVDRRSVATARAQIGPNDVGGLIRSGYATDIQTLKTSPLPAPHVFGDEFYRVCGSCSIVRLRPDEPDLIRRDPYSVLHDHQRWSELADEHNVTLASLPVPANYIINTSENHSEMHGPFIDWRKGFTDAVNRNGHQIDDAFTTSFGLTLDQVQQASADFFAERLSVGEQ